MGDRGREKGKRVKKGIKKYYVHALTSHNKCKHDILHMRTENQNFKRREETT